MNSQLYLWYLVFNDNASYQVVAKSLVETGSFEENYSPAFKCPDGLKYHALMVSYEIVQTAKNMRFGKKRLDFRVVRVNTKTEQSEWYSPGRPKERLVKPLVQVVAPSKFPSDPEAEKIPF